MSKKLSEQVKETIEPIKDKKEMKFITTGSTLLDLAISGRVNKEGGLPFGVISEISGPSGCGKTVVLSEIAGSMQRIGGDVYFNDPEGRLNSQFAQIFDFNTEDAIYQMPDTVSEAFGIIPELKIEKPIAIFTDSLAALSTDMEMKEKDGMGMRRAKEFSENLRKVCRTIKLKDMLVVCSNQQRWNGFRYSSTGGKAVGFYCSVRMECKNPIKLTKKRTIGKEIEKTYGVRTEVIITKNSIDKPFRSCYITIIFDYGIDDVRENLQFLKDYTDAGKNIYRIGDQELFATIEKSISEIEKNNMEEDLKKEVIKKWNDIENKFVIDRRKKRIENQ